MNGTGIRVRTLVISVPETDAKPLGVTSIKVSQILVTDLNAYMILYAFGKSWNHSSASY
jgi:hypothetical protein